MLFSGSTVLISVAGLLLVRAPVFRTMALGVMVAVALMLAITDVVEVEQMGFALAVAVAVDATLIRIVVVPALLRLTGRANWRFPAVSAGRGGGAPVASRSSWTMSGRTARPAAPSDIEQRKA